MTKPKIEAVNITQEDVREEMCEEIPRIEYFGAQGTSRAEGI